MHDTIFDYWGISTQQIEISGSTNDKDLDFKLKMLKQGQDLMKEFESEKPPVKEATPGEINELAKKLNNLRQTVA